MAYQADDQ